MSPLAIKDAQRYFAWFYAGLLFSGLVLILLKSGFNSVSMFFSIVLICWVLSLIKQIRFVLKITGAMCIVFAMFLPIAIFNPFAALDGVQSPPVSTVLLWIVPIEIIALASAYILDHPGGANRNSGSAS
jgi:hypothetical protein